MKLHHAGDVKRTVLLAGAALLLAAALLLRGAVRPEPARDAAIDALSLKYRDQANKAQPGPPPSEPAAALAIAARTDTAVGGFALVSTIIHRAPMWGWRVLIADRKCYTDKHGYASINICEENEILRSEKQEPGWNKVWALLYALNHPANYSWIFLVDDDVLISNKQRSLQSIVKEAGPDVHVIFPQQGERACVFSNYAMLVRNSPTGRRFAQMWWDERPVPPNKGCGYMDQCPMWRTILRMLNEEKLRGKAGGVGGGFVLPAWDMHGDGNGQRLKLPDMEFEQGLRRAKINCIGKGQAQKVAAPFSFASAHEFVLQSKIYEPWAQGLKPHLWASAFAMHTGPAINSSFVVWWNKMHARTCAPFALRSPPGCNNGKNLDIDGLISFPVDEVPKGSWKCLFCADDQHPNAAAGVLAALKAMTRTTLAPPKPDIKKQMALHYVLKKDQKDAEDQFYMAGRKGGR